MLLELPCHAASVKSSDSLGQSQAVSPRANFGQVHSSWWPWWTEKRECVTTCSHNFSLWATCAEFAWGLQTCSSLSMTPSLREGFAPPVFQAVAGMGGELAQLALVMRAEIERSYGSRTLQNLALGHLCDMLNECSKPLFSNQLDAWVFFLWRADPGFGK